MLSRHTIDTKLNLSKIKSLIFSFNSLAFKLLRCSEDTIILVLSKGHFYSVLTLLALSLYVINYNTNLAGRNLNALLPYIYVNTFVQNDVFYRLLCCSSGKLSDNVDATWSTLLK